MQDSVPICPIATMMLKLRRCFAPADRYRSYRKTGDARVSVFRVWQRRALDRPDLRFTKARLLCFHEPGDVARASCKELGAVWAGGSDECRAENSMRQLSLHP